MNERLRALGLVVVAFVAAGLVVSFMRSREDPAQAASAADPRPPKPALAPSGAVAIEGQRFADAGALLIPIPIDPRAFDAGSVRVAPIDPETGRPLEPARVHEGARPGQPIPRRVIDRGAF
jgi:hypothetical protein